MNRPTISIPAASKTSAPSVVPSAAPTSAPKANASAPTPIRATPIQPPSAKANTASPAPTPAPKSAGATATQATPVQPPSAKANTASPAPTPAPKSAGATVTQATPVQPPSAPAQPSPAQAPSAPAKADAPEFEAQLLTALRAIWRELREIKELLKAQQAQPSPSPAPAEVRAPNLRRLLGEYPSFDWGEIGAKVLSADEYGATAVAWGGHTFVRRTNPKFGAEVWFSRSTGRGEDGEISYERLITFAEPPEAEPLPKAVRERLR